MPANDSTSSGMRGTYQRRMLEVRGAFEAGGATGAVTIAARAAAVDELVSGLWREAVERDKRLAKGVALVAIGGYGRRELFPYSDVDLLFLLDGRLAEKDVKDASAGVLKDLKRFQKEKEDDLQRYMASPLQLTHLEKLTLYRSPMPDVTLIGRRRTWKRGKRHNRTPLTFIHNEQLGKSVSRTRDWTSLAALP